ncbi:MULTISPECIES: DUF4394 domain-containing protein [Marinomonas]|uniref:DUF4394 domain-containing protein n=1 Tax=Marinomonas rhodophyticola TaxID=2992803 RepID=A0ABT3KJR9_9GAMM|nr:DUF4394 domain-containing protein [Marinomonas sp. KJ51-3]MCW4630787.1 DUF4394 domain-containing protein [Marinomonas sp. KJ51-3]
MRQIRSLCFAMLMLSGSLQAQSIQEIAPDAELPENMLALLSNNRLIKFNVAHPDSIISRVTLQGVKQQDERIVGIDYRVAYGVLYAVSNTGQVYTVNTDSGQMTPIGEPTQQVVLEGALYGVDFNPAADRIRVVTDAGVNSRMHPEMGLYVDNNSDLAGVQLDGSLQYNLDDVSHGLAPHLVAAAYTYNAKNSKLTTNFAIDAVQGALVTQGTRETDKEQVSPNTGRLYTVGKLATGPVADAHFDIADVTNAAYVALSAEKNQSYILYKISLEDAQLIKIGEIASGQPIVGIAIEP